MSALEEIQRAIEKLTEIQEAPFTVATFHNVDASAVDWFTRAEVKLAIFARTIDAQLAILTAASVDECEWADEWARIGKRHLRGPAKIVPINRAALELARAINGTV